MIHAPMPDAEGLAEPLRSRWSPSLFDPSHTVTAAEVELLLEAARWAPSRGNSQPARWLVAVRDGGAHRALVETLTRGNAGWVPRASVVLVAAVQVEPMPGDEKPVHRDYACYDLGQAAAHVTLQSRAMGLDAHQFAGFDAGALAAALGVPPQVRLLAGVAVGRRVEAAALPDLDEHDRDRDDRVRTRRPLAELAFGDRWGEPWGPAR